MKSKTIIISSQTGKTGRGILTLYEQNELLNCKLRLYNVEKLNRYAKIGIYHNNEVFTANLIERAGVYESSLVGNFDLNKDFYCAIIQTDNNNEVLLSGGTYAGYYFNDSSIFEEKNSTENVCDNLGFDKCATCKYKEYFYNEKGEQNKVSIENNEKELAETNENLPENKKNLPSILEQIIPQFDYIFEHFPINEELTNIIENSKFVTMGEGQYSLGAIFDEGEMKYICYAVKSSYNAPAPEELGKYHQWLPLDSDDPLSDGYYIVFQDTKDLKIIEIN